MRKAICRKALKTTALIAASIIIISLIITIVSLFFPIVLQSDGTIDINSISISKNITASNETNDSFTDKAYSFFSSTLTKKDYIKLHKKSASFVEYVIGIELTNNSDEILHSLNIKSNSSSKIFVSKNLNNNDINYVYPNNTELISVLVYSTDDLTQDEVLEYCLSNIEITFLKGAKENATGYIRYMLSQFLSNIMCWGVALT